MNALGLLLVWVALQVSLFCLAAAALYALARRRSPASGAWAAGSALMVAVGLTAAALSPWPRWWALDATVAPVVADSAPPEIPPADAKDVRLAPGLMAGPFEPRERAKPAANAPVKPTTPNRNWRAVLAQAHADSVGADASGWRWPAWIGLAVAAGCVVALARLAVAVVLAQRYRTLARPLPDASIGEVLEQVSRQIGCARAIELREAPGLGSPATMGWLKPTIILPADWPSWSDEELRAVLAHEVAHVARCDFAAALVAQLGVVLHFYNPLVHWLAARLRLEQEMAADVWGAAVLGSRQRYLATLANMALRRSDPPIAWAMRPFLPTRGTLMRRVEMLHRQKILPKVSLSGGVRVALAALLVVVGCFVAGLRGPELARAIAAPPAERPSDVEIRHARRAALVARSGYRKLVESEKQFPGTVSDEAIDRARGEAEKAELLVAQLERKKDATKAEPFNLDFVPNDAQVVLALRPGKLVGVKSLAPLRTMLSEAGMFKPLDLPLEAIEEFKLIAADRPEDRDRDWALLVVRSREPHDWTKFAAEVCGPVEKTIGVGQEYYRALQGGMMGAYWLPDDRTIVLGRADKIPDTFALRGPVNEPAWAAGWRKIATADAALAVAPEMLQVFVAGGPGGVNMAGEADMAFFAGTRVGDTFQVTGTMTCRSAAGAAKISQSIVAGLNALAPQLEKSEPGIGSLVARVIGATKIEAKGAEVRSQTTLDAEFGRAVAQAIGPARAAALRNQSVNKMKQIGIALHNYHDVNKHFPPAVIIGPDGKTPHSWRVEILPYLEATNLQQLSKQYRMDEPWDSEHNKKLVEATDFFSVPSPTPSKDCGYFFAVGPGTAFDPVDKPTPIRNITDGTSKTIAVVEAKRSIPWTKPEDIDFDPAKPLPKLGGYFGGGFNTLFFDGSVHFLPDDNDEKGLRALVTSRGGEVIEIDPSTARVKVVE